MKIITSAFSALIPALNAAVLIGFVAGCATLNKNECMVADWYAIGLEDGGKGEPVERLSSHRRSCAEHGITLDASRYMAGRNEGLKSYCTYNRGLSHGRAGYYQDVCSDVPSMVNYRAGVGEGLKSFCTYNNGISQGRAGHSYGGVCPSDLAPGFQAGYQRGKEINELERHLRRVQEDIDKAKAALKRGIPDPNLRAKEVERLEDLSRESDQIERKVRRLLNH